MRETMKKYRVLLWLEVLLCVLILVRCFREESLVYSDQNLQLGTKTEINLYTGQSFQATPGVYQVRIDVVDMQDGYLYATVSCEQSSFRALRCNGATIFPAQDYLDFEIYVLEKIDSVYVSCSCAGEQVLISSLEVYRINWGARILAFIVVVCCLLLDVILFLRDEILAGKVKKEQQIVIWGLLFSVLVAYFPYLTDYFSNVADIAFHWLRIEGLKETLLQGNQFPVRVQSYWLYDHGYAVSAFYGDLFLTIPVLFRLIGFSLMFSYKMFVFVVMAATAVIAYYSFKHCTRHTYAALFGSVIYMLAPYRIYNFYNRGAVGEYLAMTFLPLVICGMYRLYTENIEESGYRKAKIPLIIGLSSILQSHILSCEMVVIFLLGICVLFYRKTFRKKTLIQLLETAGICLLINAWFWVPLLQMMVSDHYALGSIISQNIQYMGTWFAEIFQLYPNQGTAQNGMYMAEPFQMGIASLLIVCIVFIMIVWKNCFNQIRKHENPYDRAVLFWAGLILVTLFMSTRYFPWDLVSRLPVIHIFATALQFPTRFFSLVSVFSAVEAAFFILWLERECQEMTDDRKVGHLTRRGTILVLFILATGSAIYHVNDIAYGDSPIWLYNAENMGTVSVINGEYMLEGTQVDEYHYHGPVTEEGLNWSDYEKVGTMIQLYVNNTTDEEKFLELPLIGYKGYAVEYEKTNDISPCIAEERGAHGDLRIVIPGGYQGVIKICYKGYMSFRVAELVSFLSVIGMVIYPASKRRMLWKQKSKQLQEG